MKYFLYKVMGDTITKVYEVEDKKTEPFKLLRGLITLPEVKKALFESEDVVIEKSGINSISTNEEGLTSGQNNNPDDVVYHYNSTSIGHQRPLLDETEFVEYYKTDKPEEKLTADFKLLLTGYNHGFVINTGKEQSSLFGGIHPGYIYSMRRTSRGTSMRTTTGKRDAQLFSLKSLETFVNKHDFNLEYFTKEKGYKFSVEFADKTFETIFMEKAKQKDLDLLQKINEKLFEISMAQDESEPEELEGIATDEEMKQEALDRMKWMKMDIAPLDAFKKNNQIWKSEGPGILYYLPQNDPDSEKAIEEVKHKDYLPYHVIKTMLCDGQPMCAVLGVSRDKANWSLERYNEKNQMLYTQVYNPAFGAEYGPIVVLPSAGGLRRIG